SLREPVPELDGAAEYQLPDRHEFRPSQPRARATGTDSGADTPSRPGTADRDAGSRGRPRRAHEPAASRKLTLGTPARRTPSRGRTTQVRSGHVHEFPRVPGAARSLAGT